MIFKKILLIEDNPRDRKLERDLLGVSGYEVLEAEDAGTGLSMAREHKPDLVVLDVKLPDMSGIHVAQMIRRDVETRHIPIVFVTSSAMIEEVKKATSIELCGYIAKPIDTREFVSLLEAYL
jgi:CheY-like chemotaxis protein